MTKEAIINYDKSPAPPSRKSGPRAKPFVAYDKTPKPGAQKAYVHYDKTPALGTSEEVVVLPLRPGRARVGVHFTEEVETIKTHNLGAHVAEQVRDGLRISDEEGRKTLDWYCGALKGAGVLDKAAMGQLEKFASRFSTIANPKDLLQTEIEPFLTGLTPTARGTEET